MTKRGIENLSIGKREESQMARKKERILSDEEVALLNQLVSAGVRILRNKDISTQHPDFQEEKRLAIGEVFKANGIISKNQQDRLWPSIAARLQITMSIPPEEHFQKKRLKEIKATLGQPGDGRLQELLNMARENISLLPRKRRADAATIRDAVYQAISLIKYPSAKSKEAEAKVLKYYLAVENGLSPSDPDLRGVSDPSRQKTLFAA